MTAFGKKLRSLRKSKGMTQAELAREVGYARATMTKWERGDLVPSLDVFVKILDVLGYELQIIPKSNNLEATK